MQCLSPVNLDMNVFFCYSQHFSPFLIMLSTAIFLRVVKTWDCALTLSQTSLVFMCLPYKSFEHTVGKGEIARDEQFLLFLQCFLSVWRTFCHFHQVWNCRLQTLWVWKRLKLVVWERDKGMMLQEGVTYPWWYDSIFGIDLWHGHLHILWQSISNIHCSVFCSRFFFASLT